MFAGPAEDRSNDGASQKRGKDITRPESKVKKKERSPEVTLPPLWKETPSFSATVVTRPLLSHPPTDRSVPPDRPLSVVKLPRLTAGPGRVTDDKKRTEGPQLMSSIFGTHIPIKAAADLAAQSLTGKDESLKVTTCEDKKTTSVKKGKATKPNKVPLTGTEVVHILSKKRDPRELDFYCLKEADGDSYRPYDLRVVLSSEAGSEHYIFSSNTVLHVTERGFGGLVSLSEWCREGALWTALQEILFFRNFRLRKAFTWWHRNVRKIVFQRRCEDLQDLLLVAVPQFRNALLLLTRIIEELKGAQRLPQEQSRTYTLLEFKNALITMSQEFLQILQTLSRRRAVILNVLREDSYKAHQELQLHMEYAKKSDKSYEPIHQHLAHQQELQEESARSESILQKLGSFAALMDEMIVQSLVTIIQQDVISFLGNVLKRSESQQCSLFHTELCFSGSSQLTVDPPLHLFQEAVTEALLTVGDSIIQMCETCGFFLETSDSVFFSGFTQDLTSDFTCIEHPSLAAENVSSDGVIGHRRFCCWKFQRETSSSCPALPKKTLLTVQGSRAHGSYCPLSKRHLQWQISINDVTQQAEKELATIMQEAELEIQQQCESYSWLMGVYSFISQWSGGSVESMTGQPVLLYEEHIKTIRHWSERIKRLPSSISTSNQLFIIQFTPMKENLGQQLKIVEEEVLEHLVVQIKLRCENVISDLETAAAELRTEPQDSRDLSEYVLMVRESVKTLPDMQKRLEYIHSLQETICTNYRKMTEEEVTLEEKMLHMWDCFLHLLKPADSIACRYLPSTSKALDTMSSFLAHDLKNVVSKATSGPLLDPTQNPQEMVSTLKYMCAHVHSLNAKLEQLSMNRQNLQEHPVDLTILTTDVQKVKARKELWELRAEYTTWLEEWKKLVISEDAVSQAQELITKWKEQALSLTTTLPTHDAVLQETFGMLERLNHQLAVMARLQQPTLKHKHLKAIFEGMGLQYVPEKKLTVAELMSQQVEVDQKLITKICRDAQAECNMKQTFQKLQQGWEARLFHLDKFLISQPCEPQYGLTETEKPTEGTFSHQQTASPQSCQDASFTIIDLEIHLAETENDLMTLSTMLKSPHSVELRLQIEDWVQSLRDLGKLLCLFERYQQTWAFLTKMFHETFSVQTTRLQEQFQPVDQTFKKIMLSISNDPQVLNFVQSTKTKDRFHGNSLCQIITDGLSTMESISNQLVDLLDTFCDQFPRLWFLSHREMVQLVSCHPTPFTLLPFVQKCFIGVRWLQVDCEIPCNPTNVKSCAATCRSHSQKKVLGVFGSLQEHITFPSPLELNRSALVWLRGFEKQLKLTMMQLIKQCAIVRNELEIFSQDLACDKNVGDILCHIANWSEISQPVLDLLSEYPLQCLLVAEEAVWCKVVLHAVQETSSVKFSNIKAYNSAKLKDLGHIIRGGVSGARSESVISKYTMMCLRALVQLTMNHARQLSQLMEVQNVPVESSFEWLSLMKYNVNLEDCSLKGNNDPTCYVDVLGHRFQYDYEYFGPEGWEMVHTPSTDRAIMGILLALRAYRCGFVIGPCMTGKKTTVVQLGKALGRQVVSMQCCSSVTPSVVQQMLLGALQTGAWLVLCSVDLLTQRVLSFLEQHLASIHQSFSELSRNKNQRVNEDPKDKSADVVNKVVDSECLIVLGGKSVSASLSYGCVGISSKGYTSEIPKSLLCATRPVALAHPDYSIIAEVMLTSIGFSEALSLSRHLVSLFSMAKDLLCLPDFITDGQSCYLVVLQKIISASQIHLQESIKQREISDQAKGPAAEHTDQETGKHSTLHSSHLSVVRGVMEETAVVKAILSVLIPVLYEHKKVSQFNKIFKETFPIAFQFPVFQQYIQEKEENKLKEAVTEELQRKWLHSDTKIISTALTLYQTMKSSQAVMLVGPSGSGKTTCYRALAGALNSLAAKAVVNESENVNMIEGDGPKAEPKISDSTWNSVDTVVLFPNAMSHEEVFGYFCEKRGWQDGAVAKVLRDSRRRERTSSTMCNKETIQPPIVKWLVMDGKPVGQPSWLDYLSTLYGPEDPFLCLSSGEILSSQSHLKLLMEMTDLRVLSPSAVTRCSLVHFSGSDLWKAVWKSEFHALSSEHKLDQGTLKMWNCLAGDLFSSTLSLLRQKVLTSAVHNGDSSKEPVDGLQEILSFARILRALLQHFGKEMEKAGTIPQIGKRDIPLHRTGTISTDSQTKQELLARNLFLVAYIWGFSGHLHPRHWPQFNLLARQVLFACRYKIVVPDEQSVFEHFFNTDSEISPKNTLLTTSVTPKYGNYTYLLNLMLEANQPVLLAGEPGSGKTTLCKTLLSFDRPHISLPANPLQSSRDLRTILNIISFHKTCKDNMANMPKRPGLLLFMDDLHEAPCDVYGKTSAALETLRQSISNGEILTFDTYHFKVLSSETISYMATCSVFGSGSHHSNGISSRLSRLFSIFVLPSLSLDVILSIHSPRMKMWLKDIPLKQSIEDMARCIITATKSLYHAVCDQFQKPHFIFSHHDLQKVFRGMYLWQPSIPNTGIMQKKETSLPGYCPSGPAASFGNIVHLWMHECLRTFSDRLYSEVECKTLVSLIAKTATTLYGITLADELQPVCVDDPSTATSLAIHKADPCEPIGQSLHALKVPQQPKPADQSDLKKDQTLSELSLLFENCNAEETSLKSHPLQPQILQHMEGIMSNLVYGPDLSEALMSRNQQHKFRCSSYQHQSLDVLLEGLCALIDRKEEEDEVDNKNSITARCIVHRQRANQLLHILRALIIPGGHGLLIGSDRGTGRKTTVRLAAHVMGYQLMEVHPGNENKMHEILKEAGNRTRVEGVHVIVLVHERIHQSVREELLVAMARTTYPGLYTEEELRDLVCRVMAVKNSRRYLMDSWMFEKYLSQIHRNVHVFLLLPLTTSGSSEIPANNTTRVSNAQLTKALSFSCCVEVYQPWSNQSLVEVAAQCLKSSSCKIESEGLEVSLSVAMAGIHQSACQYASVLLRAQPFSPQTYMAFIAHFDYLCTHLHKQRQSKAERLTTVLAHLDVMNNTAVQHKQHLIRLQEKVAETRQCEKELLGAVHNQRSLLEDACKTFVVAEKKLYHLEEQINHAQETLRPLFLSGLKILNSLNPSDLEEVRHYRDPPDGVVEIMDAVCLLFNRPPGWESAKQLLGQANFFQELEFFDRYTLTNEQLQQLGQIVHSPQFVSQSVEEVSKACESLSQWVQAVYECCCMQHQLQRQKQLEALAREAQGQLHLAKQHKEAACHHLEEVRLQLQLVQKELQEQELELCKAERAEREATAVVQQLETYVRDWRAAAQEAELNKQALAGDALILAAIISYVGPFKSDIRTELLSKWRELCQTGSINAKPKDPRTSLFTHSDAAPSRPLLGFPISVSERLQLPLSQTLGMPQDAPSAGMVVQLLLWGCRRAWVQSWPLLADTEHHQDVISQSLLITGESSRLEEAECGMVVCADDPELLDKLDQAAERGLRVLVTHVERANPSPRFLARLARPAGCCLQGLKQHVQPAHPEFCLFLSTHLPVQLLINDIHRSILAQVHVVDLCLSSEEIHELMLTQLMQSECKKLLNQLWQFQKDKQLLKEKLIAEEDALMDYILQSETSLLQDSHFLPRVAVCQEAMTKLHSEIQQLSEELDYHESLLAAPRQLAKLAAALYQAVQQVSHLSPAYCFSLRGFITVMQEAFNVKGRPLVSCNYGKVPGGVITEVTNRMVTQLLVQYRPCLVKSHASVLKLLVSVALLQHNQLCSEAERVAFLRGIQDVEHPVTKVKPCSPPPTGALPSWIPPHVHPDLLRLERIPTFRGLIASLSTRPMQWQEYLHIPSSSIAGAVPCLSHSHLSLIERALLWKTMLPDCLEGLADAMAVYHPCVPGQTAENEAPHAGNPEALSRYLVRHEGPIILTLPSPRGDKWTSIQPLYLIHTLARCVADTKEVQVKVISFGALRDDEVILSMLDKAVSDGHWLVFNSCHLLEHWNDKVVARLSQVISSFRGTVRMCALPLVCDSPWDLKEELSCSLRQAVSIIQRQSLPGVAEENVELLLRCAVFHSVLLQRQTYKYSVQGIIYSWSQEDLLALMDAHICISSLCQDKTKALQYIAVNLVHGGHVLDSADLEVVESIAEICLSRMWPLRGGGPHVLSNVISSFDLTGQLQHLERRLQDSADINDPRVLGFSSAVAAEIIKINGHNLNVLLQASQTPLGSARSLSTQPKQAATLPSYGDARARLQTLKTSLENKSDGTNTNAGAVSQSALHDFLLTEMDDLIDSLSSLLTQLQQPFQCGMPTFASLLKLVDFSQLERRAELLSAYLWHRNTSDPPGAYRLSAFKNARGFLVAVMRQGAKLNHKYVSDIELHFQVLSDSTYPASPPLDAVYLCGLQLRGASWDMRLGALEDTVSLQPCSLPLVCTQAKVRSTNAARDTSPCKSSHLMSSSDVQVVHTSLQLPLYHCPLYLDGEQEGEGRGLADANIIIKLPLQAKLHPVLCSLRRVRLVSVL